MAKKAKKKTRSPEPVAEAAGTMLAYKVALKFETSIWRRIEMQPHHTLHDLHWAIYDAFDRWEEHLYAFYLMKPGARSRKALWEAKQFLHPAAYDPWEERTYDATEVQLQQLSLRHGRKFEYEFDFGDEWWHEITFEGARPADPNVEYPRVAESKGKSPPQYPDVG